MNPSDGPIDPQRVADAALRVELARGTSHPGSGPGTSWRTHGMAEA
jgi:hypothetical protein